MALATAGETLAIVFRNPPRLVLLDPRDGKVQANQQTCGDGRVDVFARQAAAWRPLGQVRIASGARTSLFAPDLDRLFVAARAGFLGFGSDAAILVFRPQP
jgi:hypothetical protein